MRLSDGLRPAGASTPPADISPSGIRGIVGRSRSALGQWSRLTPRHHLHAVRRYRWAVLVLTLLGGLGGGLASLVQTPVYKADAQLFFSPNFPTRDIRQLDTGGNYILQRVRSYAEIANSPEVAAAVIGRLGLPYSPEELMSQVSVTGKASTAVLTVEVGDEDPERARDIANAIADEFPDFIGRLEKPTGIDTPPVKVSVVRPAITPPSPDSPRPLTNLGLGLAGGLLVGTATALTAYARERAVRDESHAAEVAELPLVGVVEAEPAAAGLMAHDEGSDRAEVFRQLRTNLRLQAVGDRLTSLTVISAAAGDGGATTAGNLAIAFARAGETVVLVDGNLRNPEVHELFVTANDVGLANVLRGEASVNDVAVHWHPDLPLFVLPTGQVEPGPAEMLFQPDRLAAVLESCRLDEVLVIVSAPPLLSDAEAKVLVTATDATVVVARVGSTHVDQLATAVGVLRKMRANLLGLIAVRSR
ncbi:Wzz/FepE/Etk N-terminal domain-containing protein [Micromonospora sp. IBSANI012]|uniref:Wzz/FepE/Etk N-terminal domain-containing protein n=1 Tax=Micromonospora sp. IBSANI012 TaxID=3457761 RepID=UPI0040593C22